MSFIACTSLVLCFAGTILSQKDVILLDEDFEQFTAGNFFSVVGAHAEYHYLPETAPKQGWVVSAYTSDPASQLAWKVVDYQGERVMMQTYRNKRRDTHPMIIAGNPEWADYRAEVRFAPESQEGRSGFCFRRKNDRCYYFLGVDGQRAVLILVEHGAGFRQPHEETLAEIPLTWNLGDYLSASAALKGSRLRVEIQGVLLGDIENSKILQGGIGLMADVPTRYAHVRVTTTPEEEKKIQHAVYKKCQEEEALQDQNPKPVVWKKIKTEGFGAGRNLRFGDLDGDGRVDILIGQVTHHGPKDSNSELSCLTAITVDGKVLWQVGEPDLWKYALTNDVGFQIHDLDRDSHNEVVYCMNQEIIVADGATGKTKYKAPTPETPSNNKLPYNKFPRILGDSLFFCDVEGQGYPGDIVIKDRYSSFWVLDSRLNELWHAQCNTGHYPFAADLDNDGKDELLVGYSLFDHDGKLLWSLDGTLKDHADGVAAVSLRPEENQPPRIVWAASDEGMVWLDCQGNILKHQYLGHLQNPAIADFRPDLPGLETVTVNYWGDQGIIHFFNADGDVYYDFEPFQHGSLCLPINWTGRPGEFVVLSANSEDGGMFDGWGKRVVRFPADGHPDMCYAVLDMTGDCRDEVVVWDPYEL